MQRVLHCIWNGFAIFGIVSMLCGVTGAMVLTKKFDISYAQLFSKVSSKVRKSTVVKKQKPVSSNEQATFVFQGQLRQSYPRILFKNQADLDVLKRRYKIDQKYKKMVDKYLKGAFAWAVKDDYVHGLSAIKKLKEKKLTLPTNQEAFGNGLGMALQFDLIQDHPMMDEHASQVITLKLRKSLDHALGYLNGGSASLWHGRIQLASSAFVVAMVLDSKNEVNREYQRQAQAHFYETLKAVNLTEGWPEGYSYWVNSRAFPFLLACLTHIHSIDAPEINESIQETLETIGYWTIYGTEPMGRFSLFGDSGPRNDLKDESQRIIDMISLGTENHVFKYYSAYLRSLHGSEGYYRGHRWLIPLLRGNPKLKLPKEPPVKDLSFMSGAFPNSRIFGKKAFDQIFIRSGWKNSDTFISYRAGDVFTHHGHYKAGHFTISRNEPLAVSSGTYGKYFAEHRLNYYIRTISSNSILIVDPQESIKPNKFFKTDVNGGGQRILIPTGSAIKSVKHWRGNLSKTSKFEAATINVFDNSDSDFAYINSDITAAYGKKAEYVGRQLVYLPKENLLLVYDHVASKEKTFKKKWLLHSIKKPITDTEQVLVGSSVNGIMSSDDRLIKIPHTKDQIFMSIVLPEQAYIHKVGGIDYRYYVETDGDDSLLNGKNMQSGSNERPWYDSAMWRIELMSKQLQKTDEFLVLLQPANILKDQMIHHQTIQTKFFNGIELPDRVVLFYRSGNTGNIVYNIGNRGGKPHYFCGVEPGRQLEILLPIGKSEYLRATPNQLVKYN